MAQTVVAQKEPRKGFRLQKGPLIAAGVLVLVLAAGVGAFAAYKNGLFGGRSDADLLAGLPDALQSIHSATYEGSMDFTSEAREADAQAFDPADYYPLPKAAYDRDTQRFADILAIQQALLSGNYYKTKIFPASLNGLPLGGNGLALNGRSTTDPLTHAPYVYQVSPARDTYTLTVTFESPEAVQLTQQYGSHGVTVNGKTVTLGPGEYFYTGQVTPKIPWVGAVLQNNSSYYSYLPTDVAVHLAIGGSTAGSAASTTDAMFHAGADVQFGDFSASVAAQFVKKGDDLYFLIEKFPSLFVDLSALKGKWVKVSPQDASDPSYGYGYGSSLIDAHSIASYVSSTENGSAKDLEQLRLLYRLAYESGVVAETAPATTEQVNGHAARHFHIGLVQDKVASFYTSATTELRNKYGSDAIMKFDQATADYLASDAFAKLFAYMQQNSFFDLWLDRATGQLDQAAYSFRIVPPADIEKLKDTQYRLKFSLSLKDVNQPIEVAAPTSTISLQEAQLILSGMTKDQADAARISSANSRRIADLSTLKIAINQYAADLVHPVLCTNKSAVYSSDHGTTAIDGTGWLPVNFTAISSGAPIGKLPVDPTNSGGFVYTYRCDPAAQTYEVDAKLDAASSTSANDNAKFMTTDGGNDPNQYEVGTDLKLLP